MTVTVKGTLAHPGPTASFRSTKVRLRAYQTETGAPLTLSGSGSSAVQIGSDSWARPNDSGVYTFDDVVRPSLLIPSGAVYQVVVFWPETDADALYIDESQGDWTDGTTVYVNDVLTEAPGALASPALGAHMVANPAHALSHISSTDTIADLGVTDAQGQADKLTQRSVADRFSEWSADGHSYGRLGITSTRYLYQRRTSEKLGCILQDRHQSGALLLQTGGGGGGFCTAMQVDEPPVRSFTATSFPPRPGSGSQIIGINDIQAWATVGDWPALKAAMIHCERAFLSWMQLSAWWQHDEAFTGQTFGGAGGWSTQAYLPGFEYTPGSSYRKSSTAGATWTIATTAYQAGHVVPLFFATKNADASSTVPASLITITLDGAPYATLDTRDVNPATVTSLGVPINGCAVARVQLPDDGAVHSIVATAGAGGMSCAGPGIEAARAYFPANVAKRVGGTYSTNGSDAIVDEWNTALTALVAEFTSGTVRIFDIDTALGQNHVNFFEDTTGLHPNDVGQELMYRALQAEIDALSLTAQQRGMS